MRNFVMLILFILTACASVQYREQSRIPLDIELFNQSDYIDIVYENNKFSYVSYLKKDHNNLGISLKCPDETPIFEIKNGVWIWNLDKIQNIQQFFDYLTSLKIKRVYVQIEDNIEKFNDFLKLGNKFNIEIFALDGSASYVNTPEILYKRVREVIEFNKKNPYKFKGFQVDVEPYLLKDFNIKKTEYIEKYLNMLQHLRNLSEDQILINVVIPFWFDQIQHAEKSVLFYIFEFADEVTVMSYRTNLEEILQISEDELCVGAIIHKPVYLGLEINYLPDEQHYVITKDNLKNFLIKQNNDVYINESTVKQIPHRFYFVNSDKITFYKDKKKALEILKITPMRKSFSGWIIHSYEALEHER